MSISLFTAKEVANLLKLNTLTIYDYIRNGKLPAVKLGKNYRISEEDLNKFIKKHKVRTK